MTRKTFCDVCGKEIPRSNALSPNDLPLEVEMSGLYTKILQCNFRLVTPALVIEESDDFCQDCAKLVRDYIRELKKAGAEKK
jgi:hypothetical protein